MPENDDNPPDNVIPFGHVIPWAIADELRRYYGALVDEPLPKNIETLAQAFAAKLTTDKDTARKKEDKEEDKEKV